MNICKRLQALISMALINLFITTTHAEGRLIDLGVDAHETWSLANAVSSDGNVIVGEAGIKAGNKHAVIWRNQQGVYQLQNLTTDISSAYDVSGDGRIVVGYVVKGKSSGWGEAFLWTVEQGLQVLGQKDTSANAVSTNGKVIAGDMTETGGLFRVLTKPGLSGLSSNRGFFRKENGKIKSIGRLNGGKSSSLAAISADGKVIVGTANDVKADDDLRAIRFTEAEGIQSLGALNGGNRSAANAVSADGKVIVGLTTDGSADSRSNNYAFRWTQETGMQRISMLPGAKQSIAKKISGDGKVIIGEVSFNESYQAGEPFRWTEADGMQLVEKWLADHQVSIPSGLKIKSVTATNLDGSIIVGQLSNHHAFIAWVIK